ncbi:MAG: serine/threonine protein kinase [Myxococcales bacterium]|nr:serine/threonine protein kinase [Myxococcales bacterium]
MSKIDFDASSSDLLGTEIGPYTLVRRLGMGGMAETFVAIRRGPSGFTQRVCLKLVLPFFREDEEFVKLFQREARLAAKLRHSNIVGVIDFGAIGGRSYMAMELVDGVDLRVLLDAQSAQRLSPERVALLGHDLAAALNHAHNPPRDSSVDEGQAAAIVHRDISPSNVLISIHGEIMLSDFGVAKAVTGSSRQQSAVKGKIPYMSPEQLRLEPLDGRADLFGVGVVLFEALCGQRPYEGGHDPATIMLILQGQHQPLASLAPGAPPELCALVERLIEPDRDKRPDSAAELIELLDPFVPVPRVRRELGKRVAELRPKDPGPQAFGEQATAQQPGSLPADDGEQISGIVGAGEGRKQVEPWAESNVAAPEAPSAVQSESFVTGTLPKRRRTGALIALLLTALLLAGGVLAWRAMRDAGPEAQPAPSEIEAEPVVAVDSVEADVEAEPEAEAEGEAEQQKADELQEASDQPTPKPRVQPVVQAPASLTVIVYPWGDVWINGKRRGTAPLKDLSLKPGRYRIAAGQGEPTVTQTIRLRPGQTKKLKLDVTK